MTTDVCEVCGCTERWSTGKRYCQDTLGQCAKAGSLAITRAAEIARLQAVNAELVAALIQIMNVGMEYYDMDCGENGSMAIQ